MKFSGRVWKVGDDINTDLILPGSILMLPSSEYPKHMFRANRPGWAQQVRGGDILVGGRNFGTGSSRPAPKVMKDLGLACLLAESINGLFFRNCVNTAFPALEVPGIAEAFEEGDIAEVEFELCRVKNLRTNKELVGKKWPPVLLGILQNGGIIEMLEAEGLLLPKGG